MTLLRLMLVLVLVGAVGLLGLGAWGWATWTSVRDEQAAFAELIALQERMNALSVASDSLLLHAPQSHLTELFRLEARAVQERIDELIGDEPAGERATRAIDEMIALLAQHGWTQGATNAGGLSVPEEARTVLDDMASRGIVLDASLGAALRDHHRRLTTEAVGNTAVFGGAVLLYGLVGVMAFALVRRRLVPPIQEMTRVVDRVAADDLGARAEVRGKDELAHLAAAFNRMLDRQQATEAELRTHQRDLERRAQMLAESQRIAQVGSWEWEPDRDEVHWSEETYRILGVAPTDVDPSLESFARFVHPDDVDRFREAWASATRDASPLEADVRVLRPDGVERQVRVRTQYEPADDDRPPRYAGTVEDVTEARHLMARLEAHEKDLRASRDRLQAALGLQQALIDSLPAHIALLDEAGTILDVNQQWRTFGRENTLPDADAGVGRSYLESCERAQGDGADDAHAVAVGLRAVLQGERESFTMEYPCHTPDQLRWFRIMVNRVAAEVEPETRRARAVVMHVDVTERKLAERQLSRIAYQDRLTGLWSRHGFTHELSSSLTDAWPQHASVVVLDIAQFRTINDSHGYDVGDALLIEVGRRLADVAGDGGLVARIGGDEFAVYVPTAFGGSDETTGALEEVFEEPFRVERFSIGVTARFGRTRLGASPRAVEELLREAEVALFNLRGSAHALWSEYSTELDRASQARVQLTSELREALEDEQFQLHFQPKVDLASGRVVAGEALIRWVHPERGLQSPGAFIPVAEQSGLIVPIGLWVLHEACRSLRAWQDAGLDIVRISVNVSIEQFTAGDFVEDVRRALEAHDVDPGALTLEITESVFERESRTLWAQLEKIHELGVRLALDDFGTGFSSLLYLKRYPFDEIKIDRAFVGDLVEDLYSRKLVGTVQSIAAAIGADVVAEGVETSAQREVLLEMGCNVAQGYFYSMPLEEEDFRWLLERRTPLPLQVHA